MPSRETNSIAVTQSAYVAKSIRFPLLNRSVKIGDYGDLEAAARNGIHAVTGRSFPIGTTDVNMADRFPIEFVTESPEEALRLKLLLRLGDIIYLQSPGSVNPRRPPRSMYVVPDSSAVARIGSGDWRRHVVPVQEVAAPSPKVVGTTLTHQHIWNEYASLEALWVAYPDLQTLWADVGDGSDLVVL